jgi:hypothetical protein
MKDHDIESLINEKYNILDTLKIDNADLLSVNNGCKQISVINMYYFGIRLYYKYFNKGKQIDHIVDKKEEKQIDNRNKMKIRMREKYTKLKRFEENLFTHEEKDYLLSLDLPENIKNKITNFSSNL